MKGRRQSYSGFSSMDSSRNTEMMGFAAVEVRPQLEVLCLCFLSAIGCCSCAGFCSSFPLPRLADMLATDLKATWLIQLEVVGVKQPWGQCCAGSPRSVASNSRKNLVTVQTCPYFLVLESALAELYF